MSLTDSIKRAPKWTWYTAAGLGLGGIAIRLYQNRGGRLDQPITNEVGSEVGDPSSLNTGGAPPGIIVPPVILGGSPDPNIGVGPLQELFVGGTQSLLASWESLVAPLVGTQSSLLMSNADTISQLAMAGGAPQSVGIPVVSATPVPQPAPIALTPRPALPAPKPVDRCTGAYPNLNETNGKCYKVACCTTTKGKRRCNLYADGTKVIRSEGC
jgi:hypothetical protein